MRQRGRKSAEALAINVSGTPARLTAPPGLTVKERVEFERLVNAADPNHFRKGDIPLLVSLAQATLLARKLGRDPNKVAEWEKATRVQMSLATKLRMTPQARFDRKTVGSMQPGGIAPWHRTPNDPNSDEDEEWDRDDDKKDLQ
jgi:hypothetical protein